MMRVKQPKRKRPDQQLERVRRLLSKVEAQRMPLEKLLYASYPKSALPAQPDLYAKFLRAEVLLARWMRLRVIEERIINELAQAKLNSVRKSSITSSMYWEAHKKTGGNKTKMALELHVSRSTLGAWEEDNL